ncbi:hypothetical protein [uncultured Bacteroides sp.]|uniref:hypothetical protein n=1 Tax=uncultured Bacteroides sp. TaxID=162156 RepID=UPI002593B796|nr:hypothetical protein [uncultured Bacteroides sp.]
MNGCSTPDNNGLGHDCTDGCVKATIQPVMIGCNHITVQPCHHAIIQGCNHPDMQPSSDARNRSCSR